MSVDREGRIEEKNNHIEDSEQFRNMTCLFIPFLRHKVKQSSTCTNLKVHEATQP